MNSPTWDPDQYARYADERARPFHDLVDQVPTTAPTDVVDLGCGPGTMTRTLADRWPTARVLGIDSSPDMIAAATPLTGEYPGRLEFRAGDIADWSVPPETVDVIVANASLQWVPGHMDLLAGWIAALRPGGTLAFQVPAADGVPAADAFREVALSPRWRGRLGGVAQAIGPRSQSPVRPVGGYVHVLAGAGLRVNAWQTTYLHVLTGTDPVLEWFAGTGLRPYLDALDGTEVVQFRATIADRLRELHPPQPYGTVLPFPRIFVVAQRPPDRPGRALD